ncbi:MAG TPA: hypothetical protein VHD89_03970, partial [Rhodanobacteraceae bacterium]|nr:hypothetical protein [Rhodanobacteraceae bacterium]
MAAGQRSTVQGKRVNREGIANTFDLRTGWTAQDVSCSLHRCVFAGLRIAVRTPVQAFSSSW